MQNRRQLLKSALALVGGAAVAALLPGSPRLLAAEKKARIKLGLVTYNWGADWDLPTLLANCKTAGLSGVELRVEHRHAVSPALSGPERKIVAERFADSGIELLGFGTNCCFHSPDPEILRKNIEEAKRYVLLSKDCGASGVKVKPDKLPKEVAREKTITQIAASLEELGRFAADYDQEIRLEIHGDCQATPIIRSIMDRAPGKNVRLCWNCNKPDLDPPGLKANYDSVKSRFGRVVHIRDLATPGYPTKELFDLLVADGYDGFFLIEEGGTKLSTEERLNRLRRSVETFAAWGPR